MITLSFGNLDAKSGFFCIISSRSPNAISQTFKECCNKPPSLLRWNLVLAGAVKNPSPSMTSIIWSTPSRPVERSSSINLPLFSSMSLLFMCAKITFSSDTYAPLRLFNESQPYLFLFSSWQCSFRGNNVTICVLSYWCTSAECTLHSFCSLNSLI